jgi:hypothetical protein
LILIQSNSIAQTEIDRSYIKERSNTKALNEISIRANPHFTKCLDSSVNRNVPLEIVNIQNQIGYLSGFDSSGNPVYDFDDNIDAAVSSNIDAIWTGGSSGLNLDGSGIEIGHWEAGGLALITH